MRSYRRHALFGTVAATLSISGCGSNTDTTVIKGSDGEKVTIKTDKNDGSVTSYSISGKDGSNGTVEVNSGGGAKWPADAPAYVPAYPGAKVTTVINASGNDNGGTLASFETSDTPEKVISFYRPLAEKAGLAKVATMETGAMHMFTAEAEGGRSMMVQAMAEEGRTMATVTFAKKGG